MFRFSNFYSLLKVSTLYTNNKAIAQNRASRLAKGKKPRSGFKIAVMSYLFTTVLLTVMYGGFAFGAIYMDDYSIFNIMFIFIAILGFIQSFWFFYEGVYEAGDLEYYLPLPVTSLELYLAKIVSVLMASFVFGIPLGVMGGILVASIYKSIILAVAIGIYISILMLLIPLLLTIISMEILSRTGILYKYGKIPLIVLTLISQLMVIGFVYFTSTIDAESYGITNLLFIEKPKESLLLTAVLLVLSLVVITWLGDKFVPNYMNIQSKRSSKKHRRKTVTSKSLRRSIYRYKIKEILDPSILSQSILGPVILIGITIGNSLSIADRIIESGTSSSVLMIFSVITAVFYYIYMGSLSKIVVSLDNHNLNYIKALPINELEYVRYNTELATIVTGVIMWALILAMAYVIKAPILWIVVSFIINTVLNISLSAINVYKDYKNPTIGWTSTTELLMGTVSKVKFFLQIVGINIVMSLTFFVVPSTGVVLQPIETNIAVIVISMIVTAMAYSKVYKGE